MAKKLGRNTFLMEHSPTIESYGSIVGKKEGEGPLGQEFDQVEEDSYLGQDTWEKAESQLQKKAMELALGKGKLKPGDLDFLFAGDLLNQCIGTTYGLRDLEIPLLGIYGACSTMSEGLLLAGLMLDAGQGNRVGAVTSSHFCTAERQFRLPLSYGGQRTPTASWTCTASGAAVVSSKSKPPFLRGCTIGKIMDLGVTDANNMGAAMAPAAAVSIATFLQDTGMKPGDFDAIVTGDLGTVGSELLIQLLQKEKIDIARQHLDCGVMIFDPQTQDTHAGGSGCGCSASVLCAHFLPRLQLGKLKNILFLSTGALMSPTASQQGESIPGIAHLLWLSHEPSGKSSPENQ